MITFSSSYFFCSNMDCFEFTDSNFIQAKRHHVGLQDLVAYTFLRQECVKAARELLRFLFSEKHSLVVSTSIGKPCNRLAFYAQGYQ